MNAAICAAVRHALGLGLEVIGIRRGYTGLLSRELGPLTRAGVANIVQRGGTILGTSRCEAFREPVAQELMELSRLEARVCVLGHIQRGGVPTARDRILGSCLGAAVVD